MRVILALFVVCSLWQVPVGGGTGGDDKKKEKFTLSDEEKELLELTNAERKKNDLPPLKPNPLLFETARAHSANMAKQGKMDHNLDDKTPYDRIKAGGYKYLYAGENIAYGTYTLKDIVKGWMDSKPHKENLLRELFTETGLGIVRDDKGVKWYTQVFGKPR